jgi:hypothetical protein
MRNFMVVLICGLLGLLTGCATTQKHTVRIDSTPPDALVTVEGLDSTGGIRIAGATPLTKDLEFSKDRQVRLEFEKRGYATAKVVVKPDTGEVKVPLKRLVDSHGLPAKTYAFPDIKRLLIVEPEFKVIRRGFSKESVSQEQSATARQALVAGTERFFGKDHEISRLKSSPDSRRFRSLWRDAHTALAFVNPIRLKYQADPLLLETLSGRLAARDLGRQYDADVLLVLTGKENVETGGMIAGKIGMTVVGTANSYAAGYSRAMSNGDSFFVYNIYTPDFAQGAMINAAMIDCHTGEVVWANKGMWHPIDFNNPAAVDQVLRDLFFGLN